jgi:hypothetical protein
VDGKADHGRADAVDDVNYRARIGVEERLVFWGNCKPVGCGREAPPRPAPFRGMIFTENRLVRPASRA